MLKKLLLGAAVLLVVCAPAHARTRIQGWCMNGATSVTIPGTQGSGTQKFQQSLPACRVTVYLPGTTTLATLYADQSGTAKANPFCWSNTSGQWFAYTDEPDVDVSFSSNASCGTGTFSSFTLGNYITNPNATLLSFGAKCDGTTDDSGALSTASTALGALGGTLTIPQGKTCVVGANTVTSAGMVLNFLKGGLLSVSSGKTLTANGPWLAAPTQQIFTGSGTVTTTTRSMTEVHPDWWGADNSGTNDSATALQAALNFLAAIPLGVTTGNGSGASLIICGEYKTSALLVVDTNGKDIHGCGMMATIINTSGTSGVITIEGKTVNAVNVGNNITLRDLILVCSSTNCPAVLQVGGRKEFNNGTAGPIFANDGLDQPATGINVFNVFADLGGTGILMFNASDSKVQGSAFEGTITSLLIENDGGASFAASNNNVITGNTFYNVQQGITVKKNAGALAGTHVSSGNIINSNNAYFLKDGFLDVENAASLSVVGNNATLMGCRTGAQITTDNGIFIADSTDNDSISMTGNTLRGAAVGVNAACGGVTAVGIKYDIDVGDGGGSATNISIVGNDVADANVTVAKIVENVFANRSGNQGDQVQRLGGGSGGFNLTNSVSISATPSDTPAGGINLDIYGTWRSKLSTVAFSSTPSFNCATANTFEITLTGNVTSSTMPNCLAGQLLTLIIIEDGAGGHTFAFPTNVVGQTAITTTASKTNVQQFMCDGTNCKAIAAGYNY